MPESAVPSVTDVVGRPPSRALVAALVGLVALTACDPNVQTGPADASSPTDLTSSEYTSTEAATPTEPGTESPPESSGAPGTTELSASLFESAEISFGGVSFELPAILGVTTEPRREPTDSPDPFATVFRFDGRGADGANDHRLDVVGVRSPNGLFVDAIDAEIRAEVSQIEEGLKDPETEHALGWVNGQGTRSVETDGAGYAFSGVSIDGRFLVRLTFPTANASPDGEALDALVASLFLDADAIAPNASDCVDAVEVLSNLRNPELILVAPGDTFDVTWRLRNEGTCTWTSRYGWTFTGGDVLTIESVSDIGVVAPGEELDITVTLRAPDAVGIYAGQFQLMAPDDLVPIEPVTFYRAEVATG